MKRYDVQIANRLRPGEPALERVESPTGPYCLVEEVRPLLERAQRLLETCGEILHDRGSVRASKIPAQFAAEIKAFLA